MIRAFLRTGLLSALACAPAADSAEWAAKQPADPYVIELRVDPKPEVRETRMTFVITTTDGRPVSTSAAKGRAEFSSGGLKGVATLYPEGDNGMRGYGLMSAKPDLRIVVSITLPGSPIVKAAFYRQQPESPGTR